MPSCQPISVTCADDVVQRLTSVASEAVWRLFMRVEKRSPEALPLISVVSLVLDGMRDHIMRCHQEIELLEHAARVLRRHLDMEDE